MVTTTIHKVKQRILTPIATGLKQTQIHISHKRTGHPAQHRTFTTTSRNMSLFRPFLLDDPIFRPFFNIAALPPAQEEAPAPAGSQAGGDAPAGSVAGKSTHSHKESDRGSVAGSARHAPGGAFFGIGPWGGNANYLAPRLDLHEEEGRYKLTAELAGVQKDNIRVDVDERGRRLTISGEVRSEYDSRKDGKGSDGKSKAGSEKDKEKKDDDAASRPLISERMYGSFSRSLVLPDTVDFDKIAAHFKDGILSVSIPKKPAEVSKVRTLPIGSESVAGDAQSKVAASKA